MCVAQDIRDLFMPDSKVKMWWELWVFILSMVQLLFCPYVVFFLLFQSRQDPRAARAFAIVGVLPWVRFVYDVFVEIVLAVDIYVRLHTYYFDAHGDLVWELPKTRRKYIGSKKLSYSFAVDLAAVTSGLAEPIVLLFTGSPWRAAVLCRWGILLRVPRVMVSFGKVLRGMMYHYNLSPNLYAVVRLFSLFCALLIFAQVHVFHCICKPSFQMLAIC